MTQLFIVLVAAGALLLAALSALSHLALYHIEWFIRTRTRNTGSVQPGIANSFEVEHVDAA